MAEQDYTDTGLYRALLMEKIERIETNLIDLTKSIKGNGVPGCQSEHREIKKYIDEDVRPAIKDYHLNSDSYKKTAKKVNVLDTINFVFKHWKPVATILTLAIIGLLSIAGYSTLEAKQNALKAVEAVNQIKGLIK